MRRRTAPFHTPRFGSCIALLIFLGAMGSAGCRRQHETDPRMIAEWMHTLYGVNRVERLSPPVASRISAYANIALYAGIASVSDTMTPIDRIVPIGNGLPAPDSIKAFAATPDASLVAIAAERTVLDSLLREALPTSRAAIARLADSLVEARIASGVNASVAAQSRALGQRIGLAIVAWAAQDGFATTRGRAYVAPLGDGLWLNDSPMSTYTTESTSGATDVITFDNPSNQQRAANTSDRALILSRPKAATASTLPAVNMSRASEPYWGEIRPFVLSRAEACAIPAPPAYSTDSLSVLYVNARAVYDRKRTLTDSERTTAYYWADNAGESGTPVGHWLSIASEMIAERHLNAEQAVTLTLAASLAQADAFIAAFGYKYRFSLIRPRTYIRRVIDSTWEPLISTPPFPDYPSAHSTQSAAAAAAVIGVIGDGAFTDSTSIAIGHTVRQFASFRDASDQTGLSRIMGGIHYPVSHQAGVAVGRCIGEAVAERFSHPLAPPVSSRAVSH